MKVESVLDKGKRYKKGEYLFKEGDLTDILYIIERGKIALTVERGGKKTEIGIMSKTQILGEQNIFSNARQSFNAEALQESVVMEVPVELIKTQFVDAPPGVKLILKSLVDEAKQSRQALRSLKISQDSSPCPQVSIPRLFCILNLVTRHTGKVVKSPEVVSSETLLGVNAESISHYKVNFDTIKIYTTRMFAESPQRMRSTIELLSKLDFLEMKLAKNDEDEDVLDHIIIKNLQGIEDFAEFYQYNLYKGGKSEVIYIDPLAFKVANAFVELAEDKEVDHKGVVALDYDEALQMLKSKYQLKLKTTHIDILEKKGLFIERKAQAEGKTELRFDKEEFIRVNLFWKVIHEIDKWNEVGYVDLLEKEDLYSDEAVLGCPQCEGELREEHKFCPHCGFKIAA